MRHSYLVISGWKPWEFRQGTAQYYFEFWNMQE